MDIHVFHAIDRLMRDLTKNDVPFGGKVFLLSGDFRQTLPVVKKDQQHLSLKGVSLIHHCGTMSLSFLF